MCVNKIPLSLLETINEKSCGDLRDKLVQPFPKVDNFAWLLNEENPKCVACLSYVYFNDKPYCVKDISYHSNPKSGGGSA